MLTAFIFQVWHIFLELSPALLFGLLLAGVLHVFLPTSFIHRRLSSSSTRSVLEAVLLGIPLPLCSCGVVPTALGLKRDGASKGASTGFLISTPQTGVDSILVSASLLGWPFALFKVFAAFVSGMLGGILVNLTEKDEPWGDLANCSADEQSGQTNKLFEVFRFAIFELLQMIDLYLIVGIVVAALISLLIAPDSLSQFTWTQGLGGMLLALLISLPLYVCTTSSVPIAASLIAAGMPTGTALVFLMAGPATNVATISMIYRGLGGRVLAIYLATVSLLSILFGLSFDWLLGETPSPALDHHVHQPSYLATACAILLLVLLLVLLLRRAGKRFYEATPEEDVKENELIINVEGMSCAHCEASVQQSLESLPEVQCALVSLDTGQVIISGSKLDLESISLAVKQAGYKLLQP